MYEQAIRNKWRFASSNGQLTVEDLWDLPLKSTHGADLNSVAQALYIEAKLTKKVPDFVEETPTPELRLARDKLALVKHIISVRLEEQEAARTAAERRKEKARSVEILHEKKDSALSDLSIEELEARIAEL